MNRTVALVIASSLALVACDQKAPSNTGSTSTGSGAPGGSTSLAGKSRDMARNIKGAAEAKSNEAANAADSVGDAAAGAWADLRTKAANEGAKRLAALKTKVDALKTTNPALFTGVNDLVKKAEARIAELKGAGADSWKGLADQLKQDLDGIETRLSGG